MENDNTVLLNKHPSATSEHSSMLSFSEHSKEVSEISSNIPTGASSTDNDICSISKDSAAVIENKSVLTDRRSSNCSVKKYPGSSRTKTPASSELWNSQTKCVNEKCHLVVALKDIRSCFHDGVWTTTEKVSWSGWCKPLHLFHLVWNKLKCSTSNLLEQQIMCVINWKLGLKVYL